jgi:hypothetical protein
MVVTELPPRAVSSILVNADYRYGIWIFFVLSTLNSAKFSITLPNVCNDLFI